MSEIKNINDVVQTAQLEGEKIDKEQLVDKSFVIENAVVLQGQYGDEYSLLQIKHSGKKFLITGGQVITKKIKKVIDVGGFPVKATLKKIKGTRNTYYDLV